ncbi:MAG TPA: hypothetical protein VIH57_04675, partial [Bacteroidales bacterium]
KTGAWLVDKVNGDEVKAEIQQYTDPSEHIEVIDIKINGSKNSCKQLLAFVRTSVEKLHTDFKNISFNEIIACNCDTCAELLKNGEKPSFYDYKRLQDKVQNGSYFVECEKSKYKLVNIGKILSDIVIEDAGENNRDKEFLNKLKGIGLSIPIINVSTTVNTSTVVNVSIINTIEIRNFLSETEMLKEDIDRELKIKDLSEKDIELCKSDIEVTEKALKEIETAQQQKQEIPTKSISRFKRFIDDLSDETSTIHKALKLLRKGKDYGVKLAEIYNKLAPNIGLPSVPPIALDIIKNL